jgi:hypothetical protein
VGEQKVVNIREVDDRVAAGTEGKEVPGRKSNENNVEKEDRERSRNERMMIRCGRVKGSGNGEGNG